MKDLSRAILHSRKSKIRVLFDMLLQSGPDAISFGIGQTDFTTPNYITDGIVKALRDHKTLYAPALGIPPLRHAIADKFVSENHLAWVKPKNVIVTNGGSQALAISFAVLSNPGDEMLLSSPNFLSYYYLADYYQLKCVEVPRNADNSPDIEAIKEHITPKTKFMVINSPNNPTGYVYSEQDMKAIVDLVQDNDLYLVSDEVYERFLYNGRRHISPASFPGMEERTLTLNALSKSFGATGLRCGYIAAKEEIILNAEKYIQYTTAGVNHPVQYGAVIALQQSERMDFPTIVERYDKKRQLCIKRLNEMNFSVVEPHGAFYIMPKLNPAWNMTAEQFSDELVREQHVACVAGDSFGKYSADALRISYATATEKLEEGFNRIEKFLKKRNLI